MYPGVDLVFYVVLAYRAQSPKPVTIAASASRTDLQSGTSVGSLGIFDPNCLANPNAARKGGPEGRGTAKLQDHDQDLIRVVLTSGESPPILCGGYVKTSFLAYGLLNYRCVVSGKAPGGSDKEDHRYPKWDKVVMAVVERECLGR